MWKPACVHHPMGTSWCCHCSSVRAHPAGRPKCLRRGPNISSEWWMFLCLRRELQHGNWLCDSSQQCLNTTVLGSTGQKRPDISPQREDKDKGGHEQLPRFYFSPLPMPAIWIWGPRPLNIFAGLVFCHYLLPLALGKVEISLLQTPHLNIPTLDT